MSASLLVILAFVMMCYLNGQQFEQNQQQQQSTTLTRENVESLLTVLSDACRAEMEAALNTQSDISVDCKEEIQAALVSLNIPLGQQPPQNQQEEFQQPRKEKQDKKLGGDSGPASAPVIAPIYSVLGFVLVFFGGIAGLVFYVSTQRSSYFSKKTKKISKKKEEKLRQKSQTGAVKIQ
mmetsp:Transcript_12322/g.18482  ORF Transcript_12322/g.18482 Transcript_12322/m.18482 type:complete len:179 (+) Transcript_12322:33-569(+)